MKKITGTRQRRRAMSLLVGIAASLTLVGTAAPAFASTPSQHLAIRSVSVSNVNGVVPIQGNTQLAVAVRVRNLGPGASDYAVVNTGGYDLSVSAASCSNGVSADGPQCEYDNFVAPPRQTTTTTFTLDVLGLPVSNSPHGTLHDRVCVEDLRTGRTVTCKTVSIHGVESD